MKPALELFMDVEACLDYDLVDSSKRGFPRNPFDDEYTKLTEKIEEGRLLCERELREEYGPL